jgi:hypothetical protein
MLTLRRDDFDAVTFLPQLAVGEEGCSLRIIMMPPDKTGNERSGMAGKG